MRNMDNKENWCAEKVYKYAFLGRFGRSDTIYHYTSPQGLLGILQEKQMILWFSRHDCLNDISEGGNVLEVYRNVCEELYADHKIDSKFYDHIRNVEYDDKEFFIHVQENNQYVVKNLEADKYICCFSDSCDSLPMWNYYIKSGKYEGYNIGISFFDTAHAGVQDCFGKNYNFNLYKVLYDEVEKKTMLQKEIEDCYQNYMNDIIDLNTVSLMLSMLLHNCSIFFKNSCFQHEEEIRAVISVPKDHNRQNIKYRSVNGYIVPYLEIPFQKENVSEITIGPLLRDEMAKNTMDSLLKSRKYENVTISSSKIPIRY